MVCRFYKRTLAGSSRTVKQQQKQISPNHVQAICGHSVYTGNLSQIGTKLSDWAVGQARGNCYSWAALSPNDLKTRYRTNFLYSLIYIQFPVHPVHNAHLTKCPVASL